jgi:hypothetical protein
VTARSRPVFAALWINNFATGTNVELSWLMAETLDYLLSINATSQQTHDRCTAAAMSTAAAAVDKAHDTQHGGFYELRTSDGNVSTAKVWWVQADAMLALYKLHQYFGTAGRNTTAATAMSAGAGNATRPDSLRLLADTVRFVRQYQTDNEVAGEQFWQVRAQSLTALFGQLV